MDDTIDLTEQMIFVHRKNHIYNLFSRNTHLNIFAKFFKEEDYFDYGLIYQGDASIRKSKILIEHQGCYRCGERIHPYHHNELCQNCLDDISDNKGIWFINN